MSKPTDAVFWNLKVFINMQSCEIQKAQMYQYWVMLQIWISNWNKLYIVILSSGGQKVPINALNLSGSVIVQLKTTEQYFSLAFNRSEWQLQGAAKRAHLTCRRNEPAVVCVMIDLRVVFTDKFVQWLVLWSIAAENWYSYLKGMKYRLNLIYTASFRYISNQWSKFLLDCAQHKIVRCDINFVTSP